jgi:endonuclease/exonuclease/phosphatase family metal-dependent hydrolase
MKPSLLALATLLLTGCANGINYTSDVGPRYASALLDQPRVRGGGDVAPVGLPESFRVVSFNAMYSEQVDSVLALITGEPNLRDADVIVLQEMNDEAAAHIASALDMSFVYYPAIYHPVPARNFGNAILSRWPIVDDGKLILPHLSWSRRAQRAVVMATLQVGSEQVRVLAVHLSTPLEIWYDGQKDQALAVLDAADDYEHAIVAGDLNGHGVGKVFEKAGFAWPTRKVGDTHRFFSVDHVLARGFVSLGGGKVTDTRGASDHKPVWGVLAFAGGGVLATSAH